MGGDSLSHFQVVSRERRLPGAGGSRWRHTPMPLLGWRGRKGLGGLAGLPSPAGSLHGVSEL